MKNEGRANEEIKNGNVLKKQGCSCVLKLVKEQASFRIK
jgi:hypothetical protein